jgi:hypothetical protein
LTGRYKLAAIPNISADKNSFLYGEKNVAKPIEYCVTLSEMEAKEFLASLAKGPSEQAKRMLEKAKAKNIDLSTL